MFGYTYIRGMRKFPELTQDYLRSIMHYDPETGIFTWLPRPLRPGYERTDKGWNSRRVGTEAGTINSAGYKAINLFGIPRLCHRLAFIWMTVEAPGMIDHCDSNRINNQWANLRPATNSLNLANARLRSTNKSGKKGVCWYAAYGKWMARIHVNQKQIFLGYFDRIEDAAAAYAEAANKYFGEFAKS